METTQKVVNTLTMTGCKYLAVDVGGPGGGVVDRLKALGHDFGGVHFDCRCSFSQFIGKFRFHTQTRKGSSPWPWTMVMGFSCFGDGYGN